MLMLYLGIDIGKRTHVASLMSEKGKVYLKPFHFQTHQKAENPF